MDSAANELEDVKVQDLPTIKVFKKSKLLSMVFQHIPSLNPIMLNHTNSLNNIPFSLIPSLSLLTNLAMFSRIQKLYTSLSYACLRTASSRATSRASLLLLTFRKQGRGEGSCGNVSIDLEQNVKVCQFVIGFNILNEFIFRRLFILNPESTEPNSSSL